MADSTLHQDVGHLEGKLESLESSVKDLTTKVEKLTSVLDQAKGANFALFAIPAVVSIVTGIVTFFAMAQAFLKGH